MQVPLKNITYDMFKLIFLIVFKITCDASNMFQKVGTWGTSYGEKVSMV